VVWLWQRCWQQFANFAAAVYKRSKRNDLADPCMSVEAIEPIAVVTDYRDLVVALRHRIVELGTSMESVDEVAGLPQRYTAKLLAPGGQKSLGRISLGPILGALGLKLAVLPDDEALARIRHRLPKRSRNGPKLDDGARIAPAEQIAPAE
jgi:hypothetical protein